MKGKEGHNIKEIEDKEWTVNKDNKNYWEGERIIIKTKKKRKQVKTSTNNVASRVSFQNITNMRFTITRF
jgi:hypothetical protein